MRRDHSSWLRIPENGLPLKGNSKFRIHGLNVQPVNWFAGHIPGSPTCFDEFIHERLDHVTTLRVVQRFREDRLSVLLRSLCHSFCPLPQSCISEASPKGRVRACTHP